MCSFPNPEVHGIQLNSGKVHPNKFSWHQTIHSMKFVGLFHYMRCYEMLGVFCGLGKTSHKLSIDVYSVLPKYSTANGGCKVFTPGCHGGISNKWPTTPVSSQTLLDIQHKVFQEGTPDGTDDDFDEDDDAIKMRVLSERNPPTHSRMDHLVSLKSQFMVETIYNYTWQSDWKQQRSSIILVRSLVCPMLVRSLVCPMESHQIFNIRIMRFSECSEEALFPSFFRKMAPFQPLTRVSFGKPEKKQTTSKLYKH